MLGRPFCAFARGAVDQQSRGVDAHLHLGELDLHALELDQVLAELLALLHVLEHVLERARSLGEAHGRVAAALEVERFHQLLEAAGRHDDVVGRHGGVVEVDVGGGHAAKTHQALGLAERDARGVLLHVDGADAPRAFVLGHAAVHDVAVGMTAARAPALGAVQHDLVAADLGPRRQVGERGAGLRLRHRHGDLDFAAANRRHDALLQRLGSEALDGAHRADAGLEHRETRRPMKSCRTPRARAAPRHCRGRDRRSVSGTLMPRNPISANSLHAPPCRARGWSPRIPGRCPAASRAHSCARLPAASAVRRSAGNSRGRTPRF